MLAALTLHLALAPVAVAKPQPPPTVHLTNSDGAHAYQNGPCWVDRSEVGSLGGSARSVCPPQTWQHWHRVVLKCRIRWTDVLVFGPMAGGTTVSEEWCIWPSQLVDAWNEQGPQEG